MATPRLGLVVEDKPTELSRVQCEEQDYVHAILNVIIMP